MMWRKLYLLVCLCTFLSITNYAQDTITKQCFNESNTLWQYSANPVAYNVSGDIWDTVNALGEITPFEGLQFWGIQDLDNNNGGGSFFHSLEFSSVNLTGYVNNILTLQYNVIGFDPGDKLQLDLILNGIVETIEIINGASGGVSTNGWEEYIYHIPDTVSNISIILKAKQNGGTDQAGWDNILITGYPEGSLPLTVSFTPDKTACFHGDTISFNNQTCGGTSPYLFYWDFDNDGIIEDTIMNPDHCYNAPGKYLSGLFVEDSNGDTASFTMTDSIDVLNFPCAWINEIHYDDNSKDTDEGVEVIIQYPYEYNLEAFTISLYNGNNGEVYNNETLNNFIRGDTVEANVIFHHYFSSMQNGAPDGISLDYGGNLIIFLSYEGSFEALNGPAIGITSTDIGVHENSSTPTGTSIQLAGIGEKFSQFRWVSEQNESFGHCNEDQCLSWQQQTTWVGNNNDWMNSENWDNGLPGPGTDVLLDTGASGYPELTEDIWCRSITINDGGYLYDTAGYLHIDENITVNKQLIGGEITDDPEGAIYHYLGSPVEHCKAMQALPPDAFVRKYNEASQSWQNISGNDTLFPGVGFAVYLPSVSNQIIFSDSTYNNNLILHNLSLSGNIESYSGFHLLSNPFLSPIDWDLLPKENIAQTVYVWYNGDYIEWNGIVGNLSDGIIPVAQGFFIQVTDATNSIEFPLSSLTPVSSSILKEKSIEALEIALHFNDREDNAFLAFADGATTGFDTQYDALKLNSQSFHPGICIIQHEIRYAICFTPVDTSADFCLGFIAPEDGEYTFMFDNMTFIRENNLYLKDNYTGKVHKLSESPVIDFFSNEGAYNDRFIITQSPVGMDKEIDKKIRISQEGRKLTIQVEENMGFSLWTMDGRICQKKILAAGANSMYLNPGSYILQIKNITKKIIII